MSKKRLRQILKPLGVGMRIVKTVISIYLSILISLAINGQPISSACAAFICTRSSDRDSVDAGKIRVIGTLIGAASSLVFIVVIRLLNITLFAHSYYIMLSLLLIPVIKLTLWLKIPDATVNACIVVLLTLLIYAGDGDPYLRILYRLADTMIGVVIAIVVNKIFPYEKTEEEETKDEIR